MRDFLRKMKVPGSIIGFGCIIITINEALNNVGFLDAIDYRYFNLSGLVIIGLGIFAGLYIIVKNYLANFYVNIGHFHYRVLKRKEAPDIIRFAEDILPEVPSISTVKSIININKSVFYVQEKKRNGYLRNTRSVCGFFSIVPLTEKASELLENERIHGLKFTSEHIATPKMETKAIYIGSIGAKGIRAKASVLECMKGILNEKFDKGINIIYTRPITQDGLRIAKKYGFSAVDDKLTGSGIKRIYKITKSDFLY